MSLEFGTYRRMQIPEGRVRQIARASDGLVLWRAGYVNQVPLSADGSDGSIYNGTGYRNGYRVRSGGAEAEFSGAACTGFIAVNPGDVVRLSGWAFDYGTSANAINAADGGFQNIGQFTTQPAAYGIFESPYGAYGPSSVVEETEGVWKWVVPPAESGVQYIRVTGVDADGIQGQDMIVTINEEIA